MNVAALGAVVALSMAGALAGAVPASADLPKLRVKDVAVSESQGNARVHVTLSHTSGRKVTVHFQTVDGGAVAGADYTAVSGTLTIPAGATHATVKVPLLDDLLVEPDQAFDVVLSNATHATIADVVGRVQILDNDGAVINEIMANPAGTEAAQEYVELWDHTSSSVGVGGWTLTDAGGTTCRLSGAIDAQGFYLIATSTDTVANGDLPTPDVICNLSLANVGDKLTLRTDRGAKVDVVDYRDAGFTVPNGASLELDYSSAFPDGNDVGDAWCAAYSVYGNFTNYGTPADDNDVCGS